MLPCFHAYCEQCFMDWMKEKKKTTCPTCRTDLKTLSKIGKEIFYIQNDAIEILDELRLQIIYFIKQKNKSLPIENK